VTIGIVTVAHGDTYRAFLPDWAAAVDALHRKPDAITIVTDSLNCQHLSEALDILDPDTVVIETKTPFKRHPQILANEAIDYTHTDWICKMDVDDLIYPHALTRLDDWTADVCAFGISVDGRHNLIPPHVTAHDVLTAPHNLLFAGSPFRRVMWEQTPGFQDLIYDDWLFWRSCAIAGATFLPSGTVDYLYRLHGSNSSVGVDHDAEMARVFRGDIR